MRKKREGRSRGFERALAKARAALPPEDIDAERAVIGAMMYDAAARELVLTGLTKEVFYTPVFGEVFDVVAFMHEMGMVCDEVSIKSQLTDAGAWKNLGQEEFDRLMGMAIESSLPGVIEQTIARVKEMADRRGLRTLALIAAEEPTEEVLDELRLMLEAKASPSLELLSESQLLEVNEDIGWAIDKLIPCPGLTVIGGSKGIGKSFATQSLCLSIAHGAKWFDYFIPRKRGNVLFIDREGSKAMLKQRIRMLRAGVECDGRYGIYSLHYPPDLFLGGSIKQLTPMIRQYGFKLVVLDSYARFLGQGADENSNPDAIHALVPAKELAEREDFSFVVIHHFGHPSKENPRGVADRLRGASAIGDVCDSALGIIPAMGETPDEERRAIHQIKARGSEAERPFEFVWGLNEGGVVYLKRTGYAAEGGGVSASALRAACRRLLEQYDGELVQPKIKDYLQAEGIRTYGKALERAREYMEKHGDITTEQLTEEQGQPWIWRLKE